LAGVIIGSIALVVAIMAVQPFTQAIWGSPRIEITFRHQSVKDEGKNLSFDIHNKPIYGGILRKMRVYRRAAEGVSVAFFIFDSSGNNQFIAVGYAKLKMAGKISQQIELPASGTSASAIVVATSKDGVSSILTNTGAKPIQIGLYSILVTVTYEGKFVNKQRLFTIGDSPDGTYWVNS